jgi:hypothetical protein
MAESSVQTNNKLVSFGTKADRERPRKNEFMPAKSQAQAKAMFAAAEGKSTLGIPQSVGAEFTAAEKPGSIKKLPARVANMKKRGRISDKAADRLDASSR